MCAQERQDEEKVANEEGNAITLITYRILSFFFFPPLFFVLICVSVCRLNVKS